MLKWLFLSDIYLFLLHLFFGINEEFCEQRNMPKICISFSLFVVIFKFTVTLTFKAKFKPVVQNVKESIHQGKTHPIVYELF